MAINSVNTGAARINTTSVEALRETETDDPYEKGLALMMLSYKLSARQFEEKIQDAQQKTDRAETAAKAKASIGLLSNSLIGKGDDATVRDSLKQTTLSAFDKAYDALKGPPVQWSKLSSAVDVVASSDPDGASVLRDLISTAQELENAGMPADSVRLVATGKFNSKEASAMATSLDDKIKTVQMSQVQMMQLNQALNELNTKITVANTLLNEKKNLKSVLLRG